jgi:hypothetical protein
MDLFETLNVWIGIYMWTIYEEDPVDSSYLHDMAKFVDLYQIT